MCVKSHAQIETPAKIIQADQITGFMESWVFQHICLSCVLAGMNRQYEAFQKCKVSFIYIYKFCFRLIKLKVESERRKGEKKYKKKRWKMNRDRKKHGKADKKFKYIVTPFGRG